MEDQLADSFFGFDASLSGAHDEVNDETEDGQDEEFYDALNEETFGTDAVGDWEEDHEKLAEITELARVRSNSYNGIEEKYNENGADMDNFAGGESDLADSISRMVFEDQDESISSESKMARNFPMESFDGSYSSSAPSGFSLWSNGGLSKGQNQPLITVPAASGSIWDPTIVHTQSSQKESGNTMSNITKVRTLKDLECQLLHKQGTNDSHQSSPSHSGPSADLPLPKPSAAWLLEDVERELTSTSTPSKPIIPPAQASPSIFPMQRSLPPHHISRPFLPPPHSFLPGSLPPPIISPQTQGPSPPPLSIVDMAMRQLMQHSLAAMAQNEKLIGSGGPPANMLLPFGHQQRNDKGFVDVMRNTDRPRPPSNHMHQGIPNFNHPLHRVDFGRHQGFPQGQMPRFPHPPFPIPGQQMHHSVMAPRKIIDLDMTPPEKVESGSQLTARDSRRIKLEIERVRMLCHSFQGYYGRQGNMPGTGPQFHHHPQSFSQQKHQYHHHNQLNGSEEWDEYSGLMTQWEKQFLLNIQRMQLQSDRPYVDDYYYTMYMRKKRERSKEVRGQNSALDALMERNQRDKDNRNDKDNRRTEPHKYTPAQFENSLGKLQLYQYLLQIEDLKVPFIDKQDLTTTESKEELVAKMLGTLQSEDKLSAILCFRKGKNLLVRFLSHLEPALQTQLWTSLFKCLGSVLRKDSADGCLPSLTPYFQKWVSSVGPAEISSAACALLPSSSVSHSRSPSPLVSSKSHIASLLGNKFGISVVASLVERIAELQSRGALGEGDRTAESASKYGLWLRFMDSVSDAAATVPEVATTLKMSMLGQHLLSSSSTEGEPIPLERLAALSKALHRLDEEVVVDSKSGVTTES
ncbi:hypothetical protein J437_LFUL007737 [Ladona fulva]|uniref:Uncharacterized protein n=1 Tax=Ladona fulva TaxID=123851 RepID=A0A8K0P5W0_LADFU|nr:hypothetical protein J437_LFUL007737 [Ladona fulva]